MSNPEPSSSDTTSTELHHPQQRQRWFMAKPRHTRFTGRDVVPALIPILDNPPAGIVPSVPVPDSESLIPRNQGEDTNVRLVSVAPESMDVALIAFAFCGALLAAMFLVDRRRNKKATECGERMA